MDPPVIQFIRDLHKFSESSFREQIPVVLNSLRMSSIEHLRNPLSLQTWIWFTASESNQVNLRCIVWQGIYDFGARYILVVNLPPLGCIPALLTRFQGSAESRYDRYGCLIDANEVSKVHNTLLGRRVDTLRTTYPNATFYLGDYHKVYKQVLKNSSRFGT